MKQMPGNLKHQFDEYLNGATGNLMELTQRMRNKETWENKDYQAQPN